MNSYLYKNQERGDIIKPHRLSVQHLGHHYKLCLVNTAYTQFHVFVFLKYLKHIPG